MASTVFLPGVTIESSWLNDVNTVTYMNYTQTGTGAIGRTLQSKINDIFSTNDYDTLAHAKTAAGNSPVYNPLGIWNKDAFNNPINVYAESGETTRFAACVYRSADNVGAHSGIERSVLDVEYRPRGSGTGGPTSADYGMTISALKQNFLTTTVSGEIDGLNIVTRNGGPQGVGGGSDTSGILLNIGGVGDAGFIELLEGQTSELSGVGTVLRQINTQIGALDPVGGVSVGYNSQIVVGNGMYGLNLSASAGASWNNFIRCATSTTQVFLVDGVGRVVLTGNGSANSKTLQVDGSGSLGVLNSAQTVEILTVADTGAITATGNTTALGFIATGSTPTTGSNQLAIGASSFSTATTGGLTLPANPALFIGVSYNGTSYKLPLYNN